MSAFLGPVHIKMYERILYQDEMGRAILEEGLKSGWSKDLEDNIKEETPEAVKKPLEEIIDQSNIHGWLSHAVANSEKRFAKIVCTILKEDPDRIKDLKQIMKKLGEEHKVSKERSAKEAFRDIHDILLDGMPCDFPFKMLESEEEQVVWEIAHCPHEAYWEAEGGSVSTYYLLRDAWLQGALKNSCVNHLHIDKEKQSFTKGEYV